MNAIYIETDALLNVETTFENVGTLTRKMQNTFLEVVKTLKEIS